jgi:hypothetical protein
MYFGDSRPQDEAVDGTMAAVYRQLDQHVSNTEVPYDVEVGLGRLRERMSRELADQSITRLPALAGVGSRPTARAAESDAVRLAEISAKVSEHAASLDARRLERLDETDRERSRADHRRSYVVIGAIAALALASIGFLAAGRLPSTAAVAAVAAVNAVVAAAGTVIQRGTVAVRSPAMAASKPDNPAARPAGRQGDDPGRQPEQQLAELLRVTTMSGGTIIIGDGATRPDRSPRPVMLHHRVMTFALIALTIAVAVGFTVSVVGIVEQGPLTPYEFGLLVPGATSILVLISSWWWRVIDRGDPG